MAICIPHLGLAIYTSPKVLSTSLKLLAYFLENDRHFERFTISGSPIEIHRFYPARPFEPVDRSLYPHVVAFVRDPAERFLSMFRNRVLRKHPQSQNDWKKAVNAGLREKPSLGRFIKDFESYRRLIPEIDHHAAPQVFFLGDAASSYDRIFTPHSVLDFERFLEQITGNAVTLPWEQRSSKVAGLTLTRLQMRWVRSHYRDDYDAFGRYFSFSPPQSSLGSQVTARQRPSR